MSVTVFGLTKAFDALRVAHGRYLSCHRMNSIISLQGGRGVSFLSTVATWNIYQAPPRLGMPG